MRVAIIPARGNSQRIPRKNARHFHGHPIICYSIWTAQQSALFDRVIVSTDDDEIAEIAFSCSAEVFRRKTDDGTRGTQEVAREVLLEMQAEEACVIYPTAPLLKWTDLHRAYRALQRYAILYAMGVSTDPLADAGAFYFGLGSAFLAREPLVEVHTAMVPLPADRVCDINVEADWQRAVELFARRDE